MATNATPLAAHRNRAAVLVALGATLLVAVVIAGTFRAHGPFSPTGTMGTGRTEGTATRLSDGRVLIVGGEGGAEGEFLAAAELYDPKTGTFTATGSMTFVAENCTATLLSDGRVLFAGGDDGLASLSSAQFYDPSTATFDSIGSMTTGREGHTATLLSDGRVLIAGGQSAGNANSGTPFTSAELYQP